MSYDAVDLMFKKPFKFKHRGMTLTARPKSDGEFISKKTLMAMPIYDGQPFDPNRANWMGSRCVGETCGQHSGRWYIEVLSPFYQGESTAEDTGR